MGACWVLGAPVPVQISREKGFIHPRPTVSVGRISPESELATPPAPKCYRRLFPRLRGGPAGAAMEAGKLSAQSQGQQLKVLNSMMNCNETLFGTSIQQLDHNLRLTKPSK
eukprot:6207584-Pleurochrysis_carterae.AAC.2